MLTLQGAGGVRADPVADQGRMNTKARAGTSLPLWLQSAAVLPGGGRFYRVRSTPK